MADGYISKSGEYISGDDTLGRLFTRSEIKDDHEDYAEVLETENHKVIWYGMTKNELIRAAFGSLVEGDNWKNFGSGMTSYPVDLGWFGYGMAAATGVIGPSAQQRVVNTGLKVWSLVTEADEVLGEITTIEKGLSGEKPQKPPHTNIGTQIKDGVVEAMQDKAADGIINPKSLTKLSFLISVYLNHLATGGLYNAAGRFVGGTITNQLVALLLARGIPPKQIAIANSGWFTWPMTVIVTAGSVIRLGEKLFQKFGNLDNLDLLSIAVSATTGEDDFDAIRKTTSSIYRDIKSGMEDLSYAYERDAIERWGYGYGYINDEWRDKEAPKYIKDIAKKNAEEILTLAWDSYYDHHGTPTEDQLYNYLIKVHSLCVKLQREGVEDPIIDKMVSLADPTILHFARLFAFSYANVIKKIDSVLMDDLREYDFWSLLEGELLAHDMINNPNIRE
jgi:hypothetical protein